MILRQEGQPFVPARKSFHRQHPVAYRAHAVDGCKELESTKLLEDTGEFRALDRNVHSHDWQEENVLILDQQAATHGNNSRSFGEACNPSSIRADQRPEDGFEEMRAKP
jgi:hypothetical protein